MEYRKLVSTELVKATASNSGDSHGISDVVRSKLREYRMLHGINAEGHIATLKQLGWTLDEFEVSFSSLRRWSRSFICVLSFVYN